MSYPDYYDPIHSYDTGGAPATYNQPTGGGQLPAFGQPPGGGGQLPAFGQPPGGDVQPPEYGRPPTGAGDPDWDIGISPERSPSVPSSVSLALLMNAFEQELRDLIAEKARIVVQPDDFSIPLHCVFYDPSGLSVCGGLLPFAESQDGAHILGSAMGKLCMYFRGRENWFQGAYFDINVEKTRFNVSSDVILVSRFGGSYAADSIEINDGESSSTCSIVISDQDRGINETWTNISRDPKRFASAINATAPRPSNLDVSLSMETGDTSGASFFVKAGTSGSKRNAPVPNGVVAKVAGVDSTWREDDASMTFVFAEDTGILSLPNSKVKQTAPSSLLAVEAWVRGGTDSGDACLVHHVSNLCAYTLMLKYEESSKQYHVLAGKSAGLEENHVSQKFIKSEEKISLTSWTHLMMQHKQSYALKFSGSSFIDCGKSKPLDITKDLTIEIFVDVKELNIENGLLGKGAFGDMDRSGPEMKATHSVPYQIKIRKDNKVEFLFEKNDGTIFSFASDEVLSTGFHRIAVTKKAGQTREEKTGTKEMKITRNDDSGIKTETKTETETETKTKTKTETITMNVIEGIEFHDFFDITIHIDGRSSKTCRYSGEPPLGNNSPLELGLARPGLGRQIFAKATISEVRLWERALPKSEIALHLNGQEDQLVSWWSFEEREGKMAYDWKGLANGKISGAEWVKSPDPRSSLFMLYRNGMPMKTVDGNVGSAFEWGDSGFYMASSCNQG